MTPGRCPNQPSPRWQRISLLVFREPGRHSSCERCLHPQLGDRGLVIPGLSSQPDQLGPLGLAQRRIRVLPGFRGLSCHLHPLAQGHLMDADVPGDLSDRTAAVNDESYRLLLVLRRKCAACRTHFSLSRQIGAAKPGVHRSGYGPYLLRYPVESAAAAEAAILSDPSPSRRIAWKSCSNSQPTLAASEQPPTHSPMTWKSYPNSQPTLAADFKV